MKSKFAVPIISLILVAVAVASAFAFVTYEKTQKIRLNKGEVSFSDIIVDGNKMIITIKAVEPSGMKIVNTSFVFEDGVLKFKAFGNKNVKIGCNFFVSQSKIPLARAICIRPVQSDITPSIVIHKVTASFADVIALLLISCTFPFRIPTTIPTNNIMPHK